MHTPLRIAACLVLLAAIATAPTWAASSASSASSDGSSASVGSVSDSIQGSSNSSKGDKVAEGEYRVIQVAAAEQQPGKLRVTLRGLDPAQGEFVLSLPAETAHAAGLAPGGIVATRQLAYGWQFAAGAPRTPFFLALNDDWYRDLQTRAVTL